MNQDHSPQPRRLFLRLSSLGDVVMAAAALEDCAPGENHWVVAQEFAPLLEGHPKIHRLWVYDRKTRWVGWKALARRLWAVGFDEVIDLHQTLRTAGLKGLFRIWSLTSQGGTSSRSRGFPRWKTLSKQRFNLVGYFTWKRMWPPGLRPSPMVQRFHKLGPKLSSQSKSLDPLPNLRYLLDEKLLPSEVRSLIEQGREFFCVMPGAAWEGKRWPVSHYAAALSPSGGKSAPLPVILGAGSDVASRDLVNELNRLSIPHLDGVGKWDLPQLANVLSHARIYLGNDTGLAHLAQAVGTPAWVIFGPTLPDMGFGPWLDQSRSFHAGLWCQPCGKDGRYCYRSERFACQKALKPEVIREELEREF